MEVSFELHQAQLEILQSPARFVVAVCGRRFGKSYLATVQALMEGSKTTGDNGKDLLLEDVLYIAPTFENAKSNIWRPLKTLGKGLIAGTVENTATATLFNGRTIKLRGSDKPDSLRGIGASFVILDEYATMKPEVWDEIVMPMLMTSKGRALFIGTPKGKNHFYELYRYAINQGLPHWEAFTFHSSENPHVSKDEIQLISENMTDEAARQELEANFAAKVSGSFPYEIKYSTEEPAGGDYFVTVDLAGFENSRTSKKSKSKLARLDETVIATTKVGPYGWWVKNIEHGRWSTRETALRILKAAKDCQALKVGIEIGALKNAVEDYLTDYMRQLNFYPSITGLTHGQTRKTNRILWALQGRFEKGKILLNEGPWNKTFVEQYNDFPDPLTHDDLLDGLAYVDQLANVVYEDLGEIGDDFEVIDEDIGF